MENKLLLQLYKSFTYTDKSGIIVQLPAGAHVS